MCCNEVPDVCMSARFASFRLLVIRIMPSCSRVYGLGSVMPVETLKSAF
jgi:hypothetical protein